MVPFSESNGGLRNNFSHLFQCPGRSLEVHGNSSIPQKCISPPSALNNLGIHLEPILFKIDSKDSPDHYPRHFLYMVRAPPRIICNFHRFLECQVVADILLLYDAASSLQLFGVSGWGHISTWFKCVVDRLTAADPLCQNFLILVLVEFVRHVAAVWERLSRLSWAAGR